MKISDFFSKRSIADQKPNDNPNSFLQIVRSRFAALAGGASVYSYQPIDARLVNKLMSIPIVYRCIDKIGTTVQSVTWDVVRDPDSPVFVSDDIIREYQDVLSKPNPLFGGLQLKYWIASVFAFYGRVALKVGIYDGRPTGIYPLSPSAISYIFDAYGNPKSIMYGDGSKRDEIPHISKALKKNGIVSESFYFEVLKPDFDISSLHGLSPLPAIQLPAKIVDDLLNRANEMADGTPNIKNIFTISGVTNDQREQIKNEVEDRVPGKKYDGNVDADSGNGYLFLEGVEIKKIEVKNQMDDLHTKVPSDDMSRHVAGCFAIPVAVLGIAGSDSAKFANNYMESRRSFFEDTIIPSYLSPIETALSNSICPPGLIIKFDRDTIPALLPARISSIKELDTTRFLTLDEKRALVGFAPLTAEQRTEVLDSYDGAFVTAANREDV